MTHAIAPSTFDGNAINDGTDYESCFLDDQHGLPAVNVARVLRSRRWPSIAGIGRAGHTLTLQVTIKNTANLRTLRKQLSRWLDPEAETSKTLVGALSGTSYYVKALCESLTEVRGSEGQLWHARLAIDGDVRWRKVTEEDDTWNIVDDDDTNVIANGGEDDAYPKFTITPTSAKQGANILKRFVTLVWRAEQAGAQYPVDIVDGSLDTASLVSANKMQADGDDIRVVVDGAEVEYWLDAMNSANTKIWCTLDFSPAASTTLEASIGDMDAVTSIDASGDISGFPSAGILLINSELFTYTGKSDSLQRFTGVTRAAKGTSAASHTAGDDVEWVQHDIWVTYGDAGASAQPQTDVLKPRFELDSSTNTSWDYDNFGADANAGAGAWAFVNAEHTSKYTADQGTQGVVWSELGIEAERERYSGRWQLYNPCGITNANFQNGEKFASSPGKFNAQVASLPVGGSWTTRHSISAPNTASNWESWSQDVALGSNDRTVALRLQRLGALVPGGAYRVEASDVTLTLDSNNTPEITVGAEQGNYPLDCILRNETTGDELRIVMTMDEDESLEVDTDAKTVTYLADGSNQFGAVEVRGDVRRDWLRLAPGNNTLFFEDVGTQAVTIVTEWEERFYG